ncbi:MAG: S-layer homology domain-containing protein [Patescibacteria group bacterium]|nr:S-layer homology domain-containing protein [Patescibacteria group bacterium]
MLNLATGTELEKAVYWMYHNGLTSYTGEEFLPTKNATRQEAAKFIGQLYTVL